FSNLSSIVQLSCCLGALSEARTIEFGSVEIKLSTNSQRAGWATRFRLRDWYLEDPPVAPPTPFDRIHYLGRIRRNYSRPKGLEWPRQSGRAGGRRHGGSHRGFAPASIQSGIPPMEPQFFQQCRRYPEHAHNRRVQEWTRRVLQPRNA